ncbi:hypothetical protein GCM10010836_33340 [Aminobacter aminovorans]
MLRLGLMVLARGRALLRFALRLPLGAVAHLRGGGATFTGRLRAAVAAFVARMLQGTASPDGRPLLTQATIHRNRTGGRGCGGGCSVAGEDTHYKGTLLR